MTNENVGNGSGYKNNEKKKGGSDVMMLGQTWDIDYGSKWNRRKPIFVHEYPVFIMRGKLD